MGILTVHRRGRDPTPETPILIMISGFPDPVETWDKLAVIFERDRFHVVTLAFPGIDPTSVSRLQAQRPWGYSQDEVVADLLALIQQYRDAGCRTIYLLGHDFGSFPVLKIAHEYPNAITAAVSEDIGIVAPIVSLGLKTILVATAYHFLFITIFVVTRVLPTAAGNWFCQTAVNLYPWNWIGPLRKMPVWKVHSPFQMHPYYNLYKSMLIQRQINPLRFTKVPLLYIYGKQKRIMFHSEPYLRRLETHPDCRHIGYDDAEHWIHLSHPDRMANDMKEFFGGLKKKV